MELLRYSSNAWGQTTLEGVSWELIPVFLGLGFAVVIVHGVYLWLFPPPDTHDEPRPDRSA